MSRQLILVWAATLTAVSLSTSDGSSLKPIHLKGLTEVNLVVYVPPEVGSHASLQDQIRQQATDVLQKYGDVGVPSRNSVNLAIVAELFPADVLPREDVIVLVSVQLSEPVALARNPGLALPGSGGGITWSSHWVFAASRNQLAELIGEHALRLVKTFATDVHSVNRND